VRRRKPGITAARVIGVLLIVMLWRSCYETRSPAPQTAEERAADVSAIEAALASTDAPPPRDGIAAVVLIDVSGSMADPAGDAPGGEPKIAVARRAALDLVKQFERYAAAHQGEPVLVGLFEFSDRDGQAASREIIPLSPPEAARAREAIARMEADGGTPIGSAMIDAKRTLDRSGLTRRHLLVVTDGENTDGYEPEDVMAALARRPDAERPSVYFVAFDVGAARFDAVRNAGGLVLAAANAQELNETLDSLLTGKILVEGQ
jgi:hypothetical protein